MFFIPDHHGRVCFHHYCSFATCTVFLTFASASFHPWLKVEKLKWYCFPNCAGTGIFSAECALSVLWHSINCWLFCAPVPITRMGHSDTWSQTPHQQHADCQSCQAHHSLWGTQAPMDMCKSFMLSYILNQCLFSSLSKAWVMYFDIIDDYTLPPPPP